MRSPTKPRRREVCTILMCKLPRCRLRLVQNPDNSLPEILCPKAPPERSMPRIPAQLPLQRESSVFRGPYPQFPSPQGYNLGRSNPVRRIKLSPSAHAGGHRPPETGDLGLWHGTGRDMPNARRRRKHPAARKTAPAGRTPAPARHFTNSCAPSPARQPAPITGTAILPVNG